MQGEIERWPTSVDNLGEKVMNGYLLCREICRMVIGDGRGGLVISGKRERLWEFRG